MKKIAVRIYENENTTNQLSCTINSTSSNNKSSVQWQINENRIRIKTNGSTHFKHKLKQDNIEMVHVTITSPKVPDLIVDTVIKSSSENFILIVIITWNRTFNSISLPITYRHVFSTWARLRSTLTLTLTWFKAIIITAALFMWSMNQIGPSGDYICS